MVVAARRAGAAVAVRSRDAARADEFRAWVESRNVPLAPAEDCDVAVNATPLGLRRDDPSPIPFEAMPAARAALDLVYAPGGTPWVQMLRQRGLEAADGRTMLLAQGVEAFRRWYPDRDPPVEVMRAALDGALR